MSFEIILAPGIYTSRGEEIWLGECFKPLTGGSSLFGLPDSLNPEVLQIFLLPHDATY
jgi:hypothetical protein